MNISRKTALITGSGIRLGRAIALALAERGCNLALHYNTSVEPVNEVRALVRAKHVGAELFQADLSDLTVIKQLFERIADRMGAVDILINSAAIYTSGTGLEMTKESLESTFGLNLFAPLILTKFFAQQLPEGRQGRVINISDAKTFVTRKDHFAYRLTKAALNEMTRMFAVELAPNITVNAIAPGFMLPLAGSEHIDIDAIAERRVPLKRVGSPEIVAENVIHILEQDFMTGSIIKIDGGESLV